MTGPPLPPSGTSVVPVQARFQPQPLAAFSLATATFSVVPDGLYSVSTQLYVQVALAGCGNHSSAIADPAAKKTLAQTTARPTRRCVRRPMTARKGSTHLPGPDRFSPEC